MHFYVGISYDPASDVWITARSNVPGIAMHDIDKSRLISRIYDVVPYLLRANNIAAADASNVDLTVVDNITT